MTYVITDRCKGIVDRACVDACPVDCIFEGEEMLYIHAETCIDCQACMGVCPVAAIFPDDGLPEGFEIWLEHAAQWFATNPNPMPARRSSEVAAAPHVTSSVGPRP